MKYPENRELSEKETKLEAFRTKCHSIVVITCTGILALAAIAVSVSDWRKSK